MQESEQKGAEDRRHLYTYADSVFLFSDDKPYFHLNMDTWYYSEWADPHHKASFGSMRLGEQPLLPTQDVGGFIVRQITAFNGAFSGLLAVSSVHIAYKPRLEGVVWNGYSFAPPQTDEEIRAIGNALQTQPYGIAHLSMSFDLLAMLRNDHDDLELVWLPDAGWVSYVAHFTDGYISNLPQSVAVTHILTPEAQRGMAIWEVMLECNFISLFRRDNSEVLARVRERWRQWEREHPGEKYDTTNEEKADEEDFVVTLIDPPPGTPVNNAELYAINMPRLREAIVVWKHELGHAFEWDTSL